MKSLYSVRDTLSEFVIGDPNNGLTTNLDLNDFTNFTKLNILDIHGSNSFGTITTTNSLPLPNTISQFNIQINNINGEIDWSIFRNIKNMITFRIFNNALLTGTIDWNIVKNMFSNTPSSTETQFRTKNTGLLGNNANFIGLDLWWFEMDTTYRCVSSIYCKEDYGFYSIDRSNTAFGRRLNILPSCTCLCSNGTLTIISDLCPTTNFTWIPTASPTQTPTNSPSTTPSLNPTRTPSAKPTITPTTLTKTPTLITLSPTLVPSMIPSMIPSRSPTIYPTKLPTQSTRFPTKTPSVTPTLYPSMIPSIFPSTSPTILPSQTPSLTPTVSPTFIPTILPSKIPSLTPTVSPTFIPTQTPSPNPIRIQTDLQGQTKELLQQLQMTILIVGAIVIGLLILMVITYAVFKIKRKEIKETQNQTGMNTYIYNSMDSHINFVGI